MYGCYNRPPLVDYQTFWERDLYTKELRPVTIPFTMAKTCQYQKDDKYKDQGCIGCEHKKVSK